MIHRDYNRDIFKKNKISLGNTFDKRKAQTHGNKDSWH